MLGTLDVGGGGPRLKELPTCWDVTGIILTWFKPLIVCMIVDVTGADIVDASNP